MKTKWLIGVFSVLGLTWFIFSARSTSTKTETQKESPLAFANTVIPELMGNKRVKKSSQLSSEEFSKVEEKRKFRSYLETSYLHLPSIENLRLSKSGDFHLVPAEVIQSSEIFGEIAERLSANPSLTPEALNFFTACASNQLLVTSVRAVCARNLKDWALRASIDVSKISIPENIERIADFLPRNAGSN